MAFMGAREAKENLAQECTGYQFKNLDLLWEALQIAGSNVTLLKGRSLVEGNKRLAAVGDAAIGLVVKNACYEMGDTIGGYYSPVHVFEHWSANASSGAASNKLKDVASNGRLALLGNIAGLDEMVNKNPSQSGPLSTRLVATTVEALIGAAFKDCGLAAAEQVMHALDVML